MPSNAIILHCEWFVSKESFQPSHKNPILAFKPVLIGCQYGLYVVYGAPAAKETQKQGGLTFEIEKGD